MEKKYLIMAVVVALFVVAGCTSKQVALKQETVIAPQTEPSTSDVVGGIAAIDVLEQEVQVETIDINPDELSGLDF